MKIRFTKLSLEVAERDEEGEADTAGVKQTWRQVSHD